METFMEGKRFKICLSPFSDLCASCHTQLRSLLINLEFGKRFKVDYEYIYLYIYRVCHCRLSCKWASFPLAFAVKSYTLVYFSSKASLLMRKSHKKNQSIDLIGLAIVEKAYVENRLFLNHNRSYWRELRPLVTPWTWPIKEGIEPWEGEVGFSCLMSKFPHHAPGVSVARSLALLALSKLNLWTQFGERCTANWQTQAQQLPLLRAGLPQRECYPSFHLLWYRALRSVPCRNCPARPRGEERSPLSRLLLARDPPKEEI